MLKPKIALIDSDFMSAFLPSNIFNQKYEVFEFSTCDAYFKFLTTEKENPFNLLIINLHTKGQLPAFSMLDQCRSEKLDCSFIAIAETFTADEVLNAHNLGAFKILKMKDNINNLSIAVENYIYNEYVDYLKRETADLSLKVTENTSFLINALNEFVSGRDLNNFFAKHYPNNQISDYKDYLRSLEKDLTYNLKIHEILMRTDSTVKANKSEDLFL